MRYQPQKVQNKRNSKNGDNTAQRQVFQESSAISVKWDLLSFLLKKMIGEICTKGQAQRLTNLLAYFQQNKKTENLAKKCDINHKKLKNIKTQKMVSKRLKGHYLRSYVQFYKKKNFNRDFQVKSEHKNRIYKCIFEYTKII